MTNQELDLCIESIDVALMELNERLTKLEKKMVLLSEEQNRVKYKGHDA